MFSQYCWTETTIVSETGANNEFYDRKKIDRCGFLWLLNHIEFNGHQALLSSSRRSRGSASLAGPSYALQIPIDALWSQSGIRKTVGMLWIPSRPSVIRQCGETML
uniref:Uncharacterized protein n=1 Tax=Anguilla anguilla TaxID=7936 RepID=A0A0E9XE97_ANGAN